MGKERDCRAKWGRESGEGRALLETSELLFRGAFRVKVPLAAITALAVRGGTLTVTWPDGTLALALGEAAEAWAAAIRNPRSVIEKLGVKPGQRVLVRGLRDAAFLRDLERALGAKPAARLGRGHDVIFAAIDTPGDLAALPRLREAIAPAGGIWAVYPRGVREVGEDAIRTAARAAGLVDVKIVRFSDTHGSVRLVIPKAARAK